MRDIESIIRERKASAAKLCKHEKKYGDLLCSPCLRGAVISAYIQAVIPEDHRNLNIDNFSGEVKIDGRSVQVLSTDVQLAAKKKVLWYCWKGIEMGESYDFVDWFKKSAMEQRLQDGTNVVIYGESHDVRGGKLKHKQLGKTLLASIIIKEAICLKFLDGHVGDTYEWVDFSLMCKRLMGQAEGERSYNDEIDNWEEADWLVVDSMTFGDKTNNARSFRANVLDRIFVERRDRKLPNILVFQDDIEKCEDPKGEFGPALSDIITSKKTLKICLSERKQ
jgi:hypothetical protein